MNRHSHAPLRFQLHRRLDRSCISDFSLSLSPSQDHLLILRSSAFFAIHITVFTGLLSLALIPSIISTINDWIHMVSVSAAIAWTIVFVLVWVMTLVATGGMGAASVHIVKRCRSWSPPTEAPKSAALLHKSSTSLAHSWIAFASSEAYDGCGCQCCSSTGLFKIDKYVEAI